MKLHYNKQPVHKFIWTKFLVKCLLMFNFFSRGDPSGVALEIWMNTSSGAFVNSKLSKTLKFTNESFAIELSKAFKELNTTKLRS